MVPGGGGDEEDLDIGGTGSKALQCCKCKESHAARMMCLVFTQDWQGAVTVQCFKCSKMGEKDFKQACRKGWRARRAAGSTTPCTPGAVCPCCSTEWGPPDGARRGEAAGPRLPGCLRHRREKLRAGLVGEVFAALGERGIDAARVAAHHHSHGAR